MEIFRFKRSIPFMRYALIFNVISLITFLIAVGALATKGLHLGVDFTGGTVIEVNYPQPPDLNPIRDRMIKIGFADPSVQNFGTARDVLIRLPVKEGITSAQLSEQVMTELRQLDAAVKLQRVEFVGPQVGKELLDTVRWRCCLCLSASSAICGCASNGSSVYRQSLPTCMTW